ncbi:MAG TPA: hypothetical protein VGU20_20815 [Stellaceae bacterium]|nr:hypothetical protein [Stellaceae bacterium]
MKAIAVVGVLVTLWFRVSEAGDALTPEQVPMRSEIAWGAEGASRCEAMAWSTEDYSSCIDRAVAHAMNSGRASMPFQLGIYCSAFFRLAQAYSSERWKQSRIDLDNAKVAAVDEYDSCTFSARSLGLNSDQICTTLALSCDVFDQALHQWRDISRSGM